MITSNAVFQAFGKSIKSVEATINLYDLNWITYNLGGYHIALPLSNFISGNLSKIRIIAPTVIYWTQLADDTPFVVLLDSNGATLSLKIGDKNKLVETSSITVRIWYIDNN
jgi:hypothetical protein